MSATAPELKQARMHKGNRKAECYELGEAAQFLRNFAKMMVSRCRATRLASVANRYQFRATALFPASRCVCTATVSDHIRRKSHPAKEKKKEKKEKLLWLFVRGSRRPLRVSCSPVEDNASRLWGDPLVEGGRNGRPTFPRADPSVQQGILSVAVLLTWPGGGI